MDEHDTVYKLLFSHDRIRTLVLRLIQHRFGDVPAALRLRLQSASQAELEDLADRVLDASSVDDLFQ